VARPPVPGEPAVLGEPAVTGAVLNLVAGHLETRALAGIVEAGPGGGLPLPTSALAPPC
jgi:hypothetical protein